MIENLTLLPELPADIASLLSSIDASITPLINPALNSVVAEAVRFLHQPFTGSPLQDYIQNSMLDISIPVQGSGDLGTNLHITSTAITLSRINPEGARYNYGFGYNYIGFESGSQITSYQYEVITHAPQSPSLVCKSALEIRNFHGRYANLTQMETRGADFQMTLIREHAGESIYNPVARRDSLFIRGKSKQGGLQQYRIGIAGSPGRYEIVASGDMPAELVPRIESGRMIWPGQGVTVPVDYNLAAHFNDRIHAWSD